MKRIGVDIGGTFTDVVVLEEESGELQVTKVASTPESIADAAITGLREAADNLGVNRRDVRFVAHGSTIGTNTVIERRGARTALITTKGFRDVLELGRVARAAGFLYDVAHTKAEVLVPRRLRHEVTESVNARGEVLQEIDETEVYGICEALSQSDVESVAVCLLFSYLYPEHEKRILALINEKHPDLFVTLSSALSPLYGEYERTSTAVINAYIGPVNRKYLEVMNGHVTQSLQTRLYLMQSNGGLLTSDDAQDEPVRALESGPTAGVVAAAYIARLIGVPNVISFDMGGTTAKAGLIIGGESVETVEYEVGGLAAAPGSGHLHGRGTGFPISLPALEVTEVGSGGGSIAWIDAAGAFRVGPRSMGARPGPACYRLGGEEPTVTDAQLVLGVINPDNFLGGQMTLQRELSVRAIEDKIAKPLGLALREAASGIVEIVNSTMAQATRLVSINKGHDPREFALLAFGGAGPMHACDIARELDIPWVIVPRFPGLHSALGLVVSDIIHDFIRAYPYRQMGASTIAEIFEQIEASAQQALETDQVSPDARMLLRTADLRYRGQTYTVNVAVSSGRICDETIETIVENFHSKHEALYTFRSTDVVVELVNLRLRGVGVIPRPDVFLGVKSDASSTGAEAGRRAVFFEGAKDYVECAVFERSQLLPGNELSGPAIVEQLDSTIAIPPGMIGTVDRYQNLIIGREVWNERDPR